LSKTERLVIEHKLYWAPVATREEGYYLTALLNAHALTYFVRPYQSTGAFGPRDFDKYVWHMPIPQFDADNEHHLRLVALGQQSTEFVNAVPLETALAFNAPGASCAPLSMELDFMTA